MWMRRLPLTFPECCRLCAFSLFHNNFVAAWALLPPPQLELGRVTGSAARARCAGRWLHLVVPPRWAPLAAEEGKLLLSAVTKGPQPEHSWREACCAVFCVTDPFPGKGTVPRGAAGAGLDVLHALLVSFAFGRAVRELEAQLEYERVRREKLESQLDDYRAEINQLREGRGKTCTTPAASAVSATPAPRAWHRGPCLLLLLFVPSIRGHRLEKMCYSFQLGTLQWAGALSGLDSVSAVKGYQFLSVSWQRSTAILHLNVHPRSGLIPSTSILHIQWLPLAVTWCLRLEWCFRRGVVTT